MRTYVADIIPKIKRFSQRLDNLTMLTNLHWVVLDELTQSKTVYIFRSAGELLIAINGKVDKAKWEQIDQNSILIDLKDESYLFRHGFFDENILALKVDGKREYALLINESKFKAGLNTVNLVSNYLEKKYLPKKVGKPKVRITEFKYTRNGYSIKMGSFKEFEIQLSTGEKYSAYQKKSNKKYFVHHDNTIFLFDDEETCKESIEKFLNE